MKKILLFLLLSAILASCNNKNAPSADEKAKPIPLTAVQKQRVSQDNDFAFKFLDKTIATVSDKNVFLSPISLSIALGMLRNGAVGTTKTEIEKTLLLNGLSDEEINSYYKTMQAALPTLDSKTNLSIANSMWYREGFSVKSEFIKLNTDYFNAYVKALDLNKSWAVDTINSWCARNTNNLIPKVLDQIDPLAMMFLMNAVYFKGIWSQQFNPQSTIDYPFTNENKQKTTVQMMVREDVVDYGVNDFAQFVDLPYGNGAFSMTVILPNQGKTTADVIKNLNPDSYNSLINSMSGTKVKLMIPRFKTKNTYMLNDALKAMGMKKAFDLDADLSALSALKPLFVSFVKQDTYVEVTEEGTKAAAVTTVGVYTTSVDPNPTPVFKVDKPFIFLIREKSTGVILFIGKMGNVEKF